MRRLVWGVLFVCGCGSETVMQSDLSGAVDMTMSGDFSAKTTCDLVAQDCPGTESCQFIQAAGIVAADSHACLPTRGSNQLGQSCTRVSFGNDDCAKGLVCTLRGSGPTNLLCRKWCHADTDCQAGESCTGEVSQTFPTDGICLPTCTPFGGACPSSLNCSQFYQTTASMTSKLIFVFACRTTGSVAIDGMCMSDFDCAPDSVCLAIDPANPAAGAVCRPLCDSTHLCPADTDAGMSGDGGAACMPFPRLTAGVCG